MTKRKRTEPENRLAAILYLLDVKFSEQKRIGPYTADFLLIHHNIVCEADGQYWHGRPKAQMHDAKRDAYMTTMGLTVVRFTCAELKSNPEGCMATIRALLSRPVEKLVHVPNPKSRMKSYSKLLREHDHGHLDA